MPEHVAQSALFFMLETAKRHVEQAENILIKEGILNSKTIGDFRRIFNYIDQCQQEEYNRIRMA